MKPKRQLAKPVPAAKVSARPKPVVREAVKSVPAKTKAGKRAVLKPINAKKAVKNNPIVAKRREILGRNLTNLRQKLLAELGEEFGQHISPETLSKVDQVIEEGDLAQRNVDEDINLQVLEIKSRDLRRIDQALDRLKIGDYGLCQSCGDEIGEKRLEVLPFADLCFRCQQDKENRTSSRDFSEAYES